jgi:signal peptidase II
MNESVRIPIGESGVRWLWISALVMVLDQISKLWIKGSMELYESIEVLPVLSIYHTFNPGAAWSFLAHADGWQRWLFAALAIGVSVGLVIWLRRLVLSSQTLLVCGLTLIVGGAIGNLIDRLYLGHVVDFILVHWGNSYFPAFNVADSAISVGAAFVIFDSLRDAVRERRARDAGTR